jgi:hypothetical protein
MSTPPQKPDPKALKEAKLAQALRDNLRRRKAAPRDPKSPAEGHDQDGPCAPPFGTGT